MPRIVKEYGQQAFEFRNNSIAVTIPFNRLDLGNDTQVTTQVDTQVVTQGEEKTASIEQRIIDFCKSPKSTKEIAEMLGYKERKSAARYIRNLLEQGCIAMTIPDKPNSQNQKYITIK